MSSVVRDEPGNQEEGKIIARHLVKDYILKEKVVRPRAEKSDPCGERPVAGDSPGENNRSLRH